jgi:hypothetical protein
MKSRAQAAFAGMVITFTVGGELLEHPSFQPCKASNDLCWGEVPAVMPAREHAPHQEPEYPGQPFRPMILASGVSSVAMSSRYTYAPRWLAAGEGPPIGMPWEDDEN